jgi:hypothetical protein
MGGRPGRLSRLALSNRRRGVLMYDMYTPVPHFLFFALSIKIRLGPHVLRWHHTSVTLHKCYVIGQFGVDSKLNTLDE